jgi:hypothetical protein
MATKGPSLPTQFLSSRFQAPSSNTAAATAAAKQHVLLQDVDQDAECLQCEACDGFRVCTW